MVQKKALKTAVREYEKTFNGFSIGLGKMGFLQGRTTSENCDCTGGIMRVGIGVRAVSGVLGDSIPLPLNLPAPQAFFTRRVKGADGTYLKTYALLSENGTVYEYNEANNAWTKTFSFNERMTAVTAFDENKEFVQLLAGDSGVYQVSGSGVIKTGLARASTVACFYKSRFFCAVKPFSIAYSAPFKPTDFAQSIHDGGEVCLPREKGEIVALVPFLGKLCILYARGIAFLSLAGTAREFAFEEVEYQGGEIVGASAGVVSVGGKKLFFLASDGVYCFDGNTAERTCKNIDILPSLGIQVCNHAEFDGKYFASFYDRNGVKRGLIVDGESGDGYYAFAPEGVCNLDGEAICSADGFLQNLCVGGDLPANEQAVFECTTDFSVSGLKTLKALTFFGEGAFEICVESVRGMQTDELVFVDGVARFKTGLRGEIFTIRVTLKKGAVLRGVRAKWQRLDGLN